MAVDATAAEHDLHSDCGDLGAAGGIIDDANESRPVALVHNELDERAFCR